MAAGPEDHFEACFSIPVQLCLCHSLLQQTHGSTTVTILKPSSHQIQRPLTQPVDACQKIQVVQETIPRILGSAWHSDVRMSASECYESVRMYATDKYE